MLSHTHNTVKDHMLHPVWPQYALSFSTGSTQIQPFNFLYSQPHDADTLTHTHSTRPQAPHWLTTICSKLFKRQHTKTAIEFPLLTTTWCWHTHTHTVQGQKLHTDWPQYALICSTYSTPKQPLNFLYSQPHDADTHAQYSTRPNAAHWLTTICSKLFNRQHTKTAI